MNFKITSDIDKQKFITLTELLCAFKYKLTFWTHYPRGRSTSEFLQHTKNTTITKPAYAHTGKKIVLQGNRKRYLKLWHFPQLMTVYRTLWSLRNWTRQCLNMRPSPWFPGSRTSFSLGYTEKETWAASAPWFSSIDGFRIPMYSSF